jgi:hypothetical protein
MVSESYIPTESVRPKSGRLRQRCGRMGVVRTICLCAIAIAFQAQPASVAKAQIPESNDVFQTNLRPLLDRYCVECHLQDNADGGIRLDQYSNQSEALRGGRMWLRVLDAVEAGIMPPKDSPQPDAKERQQIQQWIENDFYAELCRQKDTPTSGVVLRRLNRREYNNTIRDLIGIELHLADEFPPDDIGFGYDNIGSALNISPIHIEKYLAAAERAMLSAIALPDVEPFSPIELIGLRTHPLTAEEAVEFEHHLLPGRYLADFSLVRVGIAESAVPPRLVIGFGKDRRTVEAVRVQDETVVYRYWLKVAEGDDKVHVSIAPPASGPSDEARLTNGKSKPKQTNRNVSGDQRYGGNRGLHVDSMVVRGPVRVDTEILTAAHRSILFQQPQYGDASRIECARRVISRFAERAFRRPVSKREIDGVMRIFKLAHYRGESFERAAQIALTSVLVSPRFLYLVEPDSNQVDRALTEYELASRLSYFLWSTMPDESLLHEAKQKTLRQNIRVQVARMLADPKSQAFVRNFTGQWLQLRKLDGVAPDRDLFPEFDEKLRDAMRLETETFFAHILRQNRSVLELLDSDYTFVNDVLARHYKMSGISGDHFRRVALVGRTRGGVLTHAGILTLTSNHNRTSPVKRGQWILQQLLGTPPPPPPPGVVQLDESQKAASSASLRERMELHRTNPECAACHNQMDSMGFALENFDAVGRWRTTDGEFPIDASGELNGERRFEDASGLKRLLVSTAHRKFTRQLIENLLTYALGRNLEVADYCRVETIRQQLASDDYRIQNIVFGIVESRAFQKRGVSP